MKHRIEHIDIAKAIGILLILSSHIVCSSEFSESVSLNMYWRVIGSFYVPLFFVLSGIFHPSNDTISLRDYLLKVVRGIVTLFWCLAMFGILYIGVYWCIDGRLGTMRLGPLWFLIVLIGVKILYAFVHYLPIWMRLSFALGAGLLGCYCGYNGHSYFYIATACTCLPFYVFGNACREFLQNTTFTWWKLLGYFSVWLILLVAIGQPINLSINQIFQDPVSFYLTGISGSLMLVELTKLLPVNKNLLFFGKNSIVPMATHWLFLAAIMTVYRGPQNWRGWMGVLLLVSILSYASIYAFKNRKFDFTRFPIKISLY